MLTKTQILLEKLQAIYDRTMPLETPRSFFITVYEYVDIFDKDKRLEPVLKAIAEQKKIEFSKSKELEEKSLVEHREAFKKIKEHIEKTGLSKSEIINELAHFEAYERNDGSIESSAGALVGRHSTLARVLIWLAEEPDDVHKQFAVELGETDTVGTIITWSFSPSFFEYEKEQKYIERMQYTRLWYSWDRLVLFYSVYRDYEKWRQRQLEEGKILSTLGLDSLFQELQDVMNYKDDRKRYLREFDIPTYKTHLQRIQAFIKEVLLSQDEEEKENAKKRNWTYDSSSGVLYLVGKVVQFKKNNFRAKLMELISKDESSKKKTWSWDEAYKEIEATDEMGKTEQRKVYEAWKGIAEYIATKSGITDFLIYDTQTANINPSYLE